MLASLVMAVKAPAPLKEADEPVLLVVTVKVSALLEESVAPLRSRRQWALLWKR
jgi:hypothetical protein